MRNPGVAAVLSFFWPGVGQIYNGELGKGLLMVFLQPVLIVCSLLFFFVVSAAVGNANTASPEAGAGAIVATGAFILFLDFFYWAWNIYDAYTMAEALNRRRRY